MIKLEVGKFYKMKDGSVMQATMLPSELGKNCIIMSDNKHHHLTEIREEFNPEKDLNCGYDETNNDEGGTMKIDLNKKYKTRAGQNVTLLAIRHEIECDFKVMGILNGEYHTWTLTGNSYLGNCLFADDYDLVEAVPYADFKIDEPVMVRHSDDFNWIPRYFAGVSDTNKALTFKDGATSWSVHKSYLTQVVEWEQCRKPTAEELNLR